jgi:hypothetical protein
MKNIYFSIVILFLFSIPTFSQLKVYQSGYVGINLSTGTSPSTNLQVNGSVFLSDQSSFYINSSTDYGNRVRLHYNNNGPASYFDWYPTIYFRLWARGVSYSAIPITINTTGIGVYNTNPSCALDITGTAKINGALVLTSDARAKENIQSISGSSLNKLAYLNGVTYNLKIPVSKKNISAKINTEVQTAAKAETTQSDTAINTITIVDSTLYKRKHIGFIAQDLQKVFPELVYEDKEGNLAVDYISLIPVLVEGMKEQQGQVSKLLKDMEALKQENEKLKKKMGIN